MGARTPAINALAASALFAAASACAALPPPPVTPPLGGSGGVRRLGPVKPGAAAPMRSARAPSRAAMRAAVSERGLASVRAEAAAKAREAAEFAKKMERITEGDLTKASATPAQMAADGAPPADAARAAEAMRAAVPAMREAGREVSRAVEGSAEAKALVGGGAAKRGGSAK